VVETKLDASTLPARARDSVKARFVEAYVGDGGYASLELLEAAVDREVDLAKDLLSAFGPRVKAASVVATDAAEELTPKKLVESRLSEKWGKEALPSKDTYVFALGATEDAEETATEVKTVESAAGQSVQDRLAARMNLN
jgi:hypothetical protein